MDSTHLTTYRRPPTLLARGQAPFAQAHRPEGLVTHRLQGLRQIAKGKPCCARTMWCNGNPETTVWCHLNELFAGRGHAHKAHDLLGFLGCSSCHDVIDGRAHVLETTGDERRAWAHEAVCRTQAYLLEHDLLHVKVSK